MVEPVEADIESMIQSGIEQYFPKIEVLDLHITRYTESNAISVYMSYRIANTNQEDEILINLENG